MKRWSENFQIIPDDLDRHITVYHSRDKREFKMGSDVRWAGLSNEPDGEYKKEKEVMQAIRKEGLDSQKVSSV